MYVVSMHRYRWRRDKSRGRVKPMKDTKRTAPLVVSHRGEFGRASSRGWPIDHNRNCRISLAKLRNAERERAKCCNPRAILKAGDKLHCSAHYDCRRQKSIRSVPLKGEKPERSTRRSRIHLNQRKILGAFYLFRARTKNASHSPDERSER